MRTGIITFHCVHNYGAMLQCVALQAVLSRCNCETEIIAYEPTYLTRGNKWFISPLSMARNACKHYSSRGMIYRGFRGVLSYCKAVFNDVFFFSRYIRCRKFNTFKKKYMNLTSIFTNEKEAGFLESRYNCVFCGSDQIWNPNITGGKLDSVFFASFAGKNTNVSSYAVSACQLKRDEDIRDIKHLIANFHTVSFREREICEELRPYISVPVRVDIDPTLLLKKSDYLEYEEPFKTKRRYILLYTLNDNESRSIAVQKARKLYEKESELTVLDISYTRIRGCNGMKYHYKATVSPGEFLTLFKNAEYVITNSFHGTAFSLLYEKQFWVAVHATRGIRIENLLKCTNTVSRIINFNDTDSQDLIDYSTVGCKIDEMRKSSMAYLEYEVESGKWQRIS